MGATRVPDPATQRPGDIAAKEERLGDKITNATRPQMTNEQALEAFYKSDSASTGDILTPVGGFRYPAVKSSDPKIPVTVTTDGAHVSTKIGSDVRHYENGKAAEPKSSHVTSKEMLGGSEAASDIAGRKDLKQALPSDVMDSLKAMVQNGHAMIIEHSDSVSAPTGAKGATAARQK